MPFKKSLKHLDTILMAGETAPTKKSMALAALHEILAPKSLSHGAGSFVIRQGQKHATRKAAAEAATRKGKKGPPIADSPDHLAPIVEAASRGAGVLEVLSKSIKRGKSYPKELSEKRKAVLGLAGLTAGAGATAGATGAIALNQAIEALKKKEASPIGMYEDLTMYTDFEKNAARMSRFKEAVERVAGRVRRGAKQTKESLRGLVGKGTPGAKERVKQRVQEAIYGKRPGRLRKRSRRERRKSMRRDKGRITRAWRGLSGDVSSIARKNPAAVPTAMGATGAVTIAKILADRKKGK